MSSNHVSRRSFVTSSAALAAAAAASPLSVARSAHVAGADELRVGVIGCGGRGTGAAGNALAADPSVKVVALADVVPDRIETARSSLAGETSFAGRANVATDRCYSGFDAYKKLLAAGSDLSYVILATAPGFRPLHLEAAVAAGRNVFMEKPAGVDAPGIRRALAAADAADARKLSIVAGTQRRHDPKYRTLMGKIKDGAIGRVLHGHAWWNQGGLWLHARKPEYSDMEWQVRNWLYFCWLSGDHIVEQHVHNLDVCNWAIGSHPVRCTGMGGRQVRTAPEYGNIFDHFAIEYEYASGAFVTSMCRQIDGCASRVDELIVGSDGLVRTGKGTIEGKNPFEYKGEQVDPYVQEHKDLIDAIRSGKPVNEARNVAESTLTAIMGRMSAYTGQEVTWDQAMKSTLDLSPASYEFGPLPVPPVPTPGRTKFA